MRVLNILTAVTVLLASASAASAQATRNPSAASAPEALPATQLQIRSITVHSRTIYIRRERLEDDLRKHGQFAQLGLRFADYGETADVAITVDRPFLTFDWTYTLVYQPSGLTLASGSIEADDEFTAGPALAQQILERLAMASVLSRTSVCPPPAAARAAMPVRAAAPLAASTLATCKTVFVESHTIYLKGNQLQDALFTRPEFKEWGLRIVDDRASADVTIDVTRPFLTFDWVFKIIENRTGAVLGSGKVIAWDGPIAAPQLAVEIAKLFRAARPLPSAEKPPNE